MIPFVGFWIGILFLFALDHLILHLHVGSDQAEGESKRKAFLGGVLSGVVEELIPEMSQGQHSNFFALGFSLMMILDVALG